MEKSYPFLITTKEFTRDIKALGEPGLISVYVRLVVAAIDSGDGFLNRNSSDLAAVALVSRKTWEEIEHIILNRCFEDPGTGNIYPHCIMMDIPDSELPDFPTLVSEISK